MIKSYLKFLKNFFFRTKIQNQEIQNICNIIEKTTLLKVEKNFIEKIKQEFNNDERIITITDFGAGSRIFKSNEREISAIAKYAGMSKRKSEVLIKIIQNFEIKSALEFGTSLGIGTSIMKIGNRNLNITTLEGCPETSKVAKEYFEKNKFQDIKVLTGEFDQTFEEINNTSFDLIYFDGNHRKEPTLKYFETCLQFANENSIFIFDDIHWSKEMTDAWKIIKNNSKVSATIDTFDTGIVFFNSNFIKEHTFSYKF
ncbi:O-methyltransferase [Aureivirga sp. CE67]|uniref:O-methyltransferase n=1 Tax=Aureivirga sp. CE67 TaxID=1788983 RepID=UPI0018CA70F2|nr:class I SAM-dependent methyltransferase [Aureivirga sp. CE67]